MANEIPVPPGTDNTYVPPPKPVIEAIDTPTGELTEGEVMLILRTSLLPHHQRDAKVVHFIAAYLRCRNNAQAAKEAGLHPSDGRALRQKPDVHMAITRLTEKSVMKFGFDASEVVEKVKEIAGVDPIEFENEDGTFKTHMKDIAPESRRAIKKFKAKNLYELDPNGMKVFVGQLIEVELWDKMKAIELLGREKDLFKETRKIEHDVTKNMAAVLLDSKRRGEEHSRSMIDVTPVKQLNEGVANGEEETEG